MGELGGGCESDAVCSGDLACALIVSVPGIFTAQTCSTCLQDMDCQGSQLCGLEIDIPTLSGVRECINPGSQPNGATCDFQTTGDAACTSGHCATVDVMGILDLGVCGECESNADCNGQQTCVPGQVDFQAGTIGSVCQ
jgi:hypothetical protein